MFQEDRMSRIMSHLHEHGRMTVADICKLLGVSRDTARRDIVRLTESGAVMRTHGGVALPGSHLKVGRYLTRQTVETVAKERIGSWAADYVEEGDTLFLDVSTTVQAMIPQIRARSLEVVTHSLDNVWLLANKAGVETHVLGGALRPESRHLGGYATLQRLADFRFTKAFIGAAGITEEGIYYCLEEDIGFKRELAKRADEVIILADATKFGAYSSFRALELEAVTMIVTNGPVRQGLHETLTNQGIRIVTVE